jgi:hypothetical protein
MPCPTACRTRVQGDCSTERPFLSISDRLDGSKPMEAVGRFFLCGRCRTQVLICSDCDRGQSYCSGACSKLVRLASIREAGRRYQSSRRGRFAHALRMRRYRAQRKKVTHQGSLPPPADALLAVDSAATTTTASPVCTSSIIPAWHCHFCRCRCSEFVRRDFLRGRPVQAHARQRARPRPGDEDDHSP